MRRLRFALWLGLGAILLVGYFALRSFGLLGGASLARPREVPHGDQEIAFIQAATIGSSWERLVAGIQHVKENWPGLIVEDENAFPEQTAAVPEVALGFAGCKTRLWLRWYKMTSDAGIADWIGELSRRDPAPLAILGGGSSDRARDLAMTLAGQVEWKGARPLLLITTATADNLYLEKENEYGKPLMEIYPGRSFRFCFTNTQMADAVRDFLWSQPGLRPVGEETWSPAEAASGLSCHLWNSLTLLAAGARERPPGVHVLEWRDDPYSLDLSAQFRKVLQTPGLAPVNVDMFRLDYSVGDYYTPNPKEQFGISALTRMMAGSSDLRQLLVLPAVDKPARRILRGLTTAAPMEIRNLVAVTGDSIAFNTVYRDRAIAWNIQEMPVPLVFFCHQNPVAWSQESGSRKQEAGVGPNDNATDDELLNADIVRLLLQAVFVASPGSDGEPCPQLLADADALAAELHLVSLPGHQDWFFGEDGNRLGGSGEYVVCLRPRMQGDIVLPVATIEVWTRPEEAAAGIRWRLIRTLQVDYTDRPPGEIGHGAL